MTDGHGIVVAVDGSTSSDAAVDWAARDAALRHVPLTIVHVQPADEVGPWLDFPVALPQEYLAERDRRSQEIVDDALRVVVDAVSESREFPVHTTVLTGARMPALIEVSTGADMIVLGRRGMGGLRGLLLGSTSSTLVQHAHCPVAVVREEPSHTGPHHRPVLVGIDGSRASELAAVIAFDDPGRGRDLMAKADLDQTMMDIGATVEALAAKGGKVGVIGFCWGGGLALRSAQTLDIAGGVAFYGTRMPSYLDRPLKAPMLAHFGTLDDHTPPEGIAEVKAYLPEIETHMYEAGHAFANDQRPSYVADAAALAHDRTKAFFATHIG